MDGDPPSVRLNGLQVYNNRVLRTGTETAQLQNLGDGTQVHHNVFAFGAIDWRAAFSGYQDNGSQTSVRAGTISFHHNVIMGGAQSLVKESLAPWGMYAGCPVRRIRERSRALLKHEAAFLNEEE